MFTGRFFQGLILHQEDKKSRSSPEEVKNSDHLCGIFHFFKIGTEMNADARSGIIIIAPEKGLFILNTAPDISFAKIPI